MNGTLILIAATKNKHKTAEFRDIFSSVSGGKIEVLSEERPLKAILPARRNIPRRRKREIPSPQMRL